MVLDNTFLCIGHQGIGIYVIDCSQLNEINAYVVMVKVIYCYHCVSISLNKKNSSRMNVEANVENHVTLLRFYIVQYSYTLIINNVLEVKIG